jgi:carbon-monoxide dehydrogenase large subunit
MDADGKVEVLTGVTSPGGGNETGIAQIVADELGLSPSSITVIQGDTDRGPLGYGNYSGRSTVLGGNAAALAARRLRARLDLGESPPLTETYEYKPGNSSRTPDARGRIQPYPTYSNAFFVVVVDVDTDTGKVTVLDIAVVHDCGVMINPALVEGQMRGAVTMGIGGALSERTVFDANGAIISDRFKTYLLPRANDLPAIKLGHQITPSPFTELGVKGAGEAGVGGGLAAVASAVEDALAPEGVVVRALPLTPPVVRELILSAREAARAA